MFELAQLRCFAMVAQELHFGRAAARLNMTQPPLSRQIQLLEHQLQVKLFERSSRAVRLTPAGRSFLIDAKQLLALATDATISARRVAVGEAGSLVMGFTAASGYSFLPSLISQAARELPNVDIVLKEMVSRDQIDALESGKIDLALLRPPVRRANFSTLCVQTEKLRLALPEGHPLLARNTLSFRDISNLPFISYTPVETKFVSDRISEICRRLEIEGPRYVQYVTQIHSALALVSAGIGATLVPQSAGRLHFEGVVLRDIEQAEDFPVQLHIAWREDNDNPALAAMLQIATNSRQ